MHQAKGTLEIEVDKGEMSAQLVLTASAGGETWTPAKVQALLEEKGIKEGVSRENIKSALKRFNELPDGESLREECARGSEPLREEPEYYEWKELPVPESMKREAELIFKSAPPPDIKARRIEKVKVKKKILKKSKLPFVPPKETVVEAWEKRTVEEPAPVNPKVVDRGYVEQGNVLAELCAGEPGRDGLTVYGKIIAAPSAVPKPFYPGDGVKVERNALIAEKSGFFRRGANWAEIFDFLPHSWELSLSPDRATLLLSFVPGHAGASLPDPDALFTEARESHGFPTEALRSREDVRDLIERSVLSGKALERVPLTRDRDASFSVDVSEDKLRASLKVSKGSGRGKALVLKDVGAAIKAARLVGLDYDKIRTDLLEFYRGSGTELLDYLLAEGTPPGRGADREFEFAVDFLPDTEYEELKQTTSPFPSESTYPAAGAERLARVSNGLVIAVLTAADSGEPGKDVFGKVIPGIPGIDPHIELLENIRMERDQFIAEADGLLEVFSGEDGKVLRVREHADAEVRVELSPDRMEAWLTVEPPAGTGAPVGREQIDAALDSVGVIKGIMDGAIAEALEISGAGTPVRRSVVAKGKKPDDAGGSRIKLAVETASGKGVTITAGGRADFRNQDRFISVKEGQLLAEIVPDGKTSEDGWDLTGKVISAKEAPALDIETGPNVRKEEEGDLVRLYARCAGELVFDKKRIDVVQVHTVSGDVDLSSGNVKFPGTVAVSGSVRSGFSILAEGHVKIAGNVEAALVSAGESVMIAQGIVGAGKAVIRSKTTIETIFAEQATLLAVGNVSIKNGCLRAMVKCNGKLRLVSEKGNLIGGIVRAREGLAAADIGNDKGVRTEISFGQDYLVMDRIEVEEREMNRLREEIARLDKSMGALEKEGVREKLEKARKEKLKMMKMLEKRGLMLFTLRERFEQHFDAKIEVRGTIYPGAVIESHGRYWSTSTPKKGISLVFDQETGHIVEEKSSPADKGEKSA